MAQRFDTYDQSVVLDGFEAGISNSPYSGIANMQCVNPTTIPGEASVNFSTTNATPPTAIASGTITGAAGTGGGGTSAFLTFTGATGLENGMAIQITVSSGLTGLASGIYWVMNLSGGTFQPGETYERAAHTAITATGTGTFTVYAMDIPHYIVNQAPQNVSATTYQFLSDDSGQVWSNTQTTTSGYWVYTGNTTTTGRGMGLVWYQGSDGKGWLFVFRNGQIDYAQTNGTTGANVTALTWVYGWKPADGSSANFAYLKTGTADPSSHESIVTPDNAVYYCDLNWIGRWYENTGKIFDPTDITTYTFDQTQLLPFIDRANCLAYLGTNLLVGGINNVIYPWNRFDTHYNYPILLPERNIVKMVTAGNNTYAFAGNRGNVYITNGSQADVFKKVPDQISTTIEPYYTWGGACTTKRKLYFGIQCFNNAQSNENFYGGVWAVDLDSGAMYLAHQLSYGAYSGLATALAVSPASQPSGAGLLIGWNNTGPTNGLDVSSRNPYTSSQANIEFDIIPIGTYTKPRSMTRIEYKLSRPLVSGESIALSYRTDGNILKDPTSSYTAIATDSTTGNFSNSYPLNFGNAQWLQIQVILNSTVSSPSYVRLREIRITGLVGPTLANNPILSL